MELAYHYVADICPKKEKWIIQARIIRLWTVPSFNDPTENFSIDMVLLDSKGGKIQATVKKSLISTFQLKLNEGNLYTISNFGVGQNKGEYKPMSHAYKINFQATTTIVDLAQANIPTYGFDFVPFNKILTNNLDNSCLIDVIGHLTEISSPIPEEFIRNGNPQKKLIIKLEDLEKNVLSCTLWNQYADQLKNYLSEHQDCQIIIIIQFAKIKLWQGSTTLSTSLFATRLLINADIDEVEEFKQRGVKGGNTSSDVLTQINSQFSQKKEDEFLKKSDRKAIDEILETQEVRNCVTLATIDSIETENGWFYTACKKDYKKVKEKVVDGKNKFYCDKCNTAVNAIPRFKVQVRVVDDSGSASFVLFEREVMQIIGKSSLYIRECQTKEGESNTFPHDLYALLERKFLFKIKISDYNLMQNWPVFTVVKISEDKNLIKAFQEANDASQIQELDEFDDSTTCDNDDRSEMCSNSCITPNQKRKINNFEGVDNEGQYASSEFSTNKCKRKIVVKKEKEDNVS